jgi:predicted nucleic acid-binding Zn ribbon protein
MVMRSLPYIGIARMHMAGVPPEKISYVVEKAVEARKAGCSDEEIKKVIAKARARAKIKTL